MATIVPLREREEHRRRGREAHPAGDPRHAHPAGRPRLRVVPTDYVPAHVRRRRARRLVAFTGALIVLGLLAVASLHVVLTQGQFELERLEQKATEEQARFDRLRLQVAELESPERVVAAAQERLGMVPPPGVTYLSPAGLAGELGGEGARSPRGSLREWSAVKPHLASQPHAAAGP